MMHTGVQVTLLPQEGLILDVRGLTILDPVDLETKINMIPGVVTNGIFARRPADVLLLATPDGIKTLKR